MRQVSGSDREVWHRAWLQRLWQDVRLAVRLWSRTPGFSAVAIATVGLGVGASTALIGQLNAVFWTTLPVVEPQNLRLMAWTSPRHPFVLGPNVIAGPRVDDADTFGSVSYPAYVEMRRHSRAFSDVACWADLGEARPVILRELGFGHVQFVSGNYFRALGVRAAVGRTLQPEDEPATGWIPVAMISHHFWQRTFGGAPDVTARTIHLNGHAFSIVGVMPQGFFGMDAASSPDLVVPITALPMAAATQNPLENRGLWNVCRVVVRVAPGRSEHEGRAELERVLAETIAAVPPSEPYEPPRVLLAPAAYGLSTLRDGIAAPFTILLAGVGGVLLAACANIASLLLARSSARSREIATRLALGASRRRVFSQLMTESLVLSSAGAVVGLVLAYWLSQASGALLSQFMPTLFGADRTIVLTPAVDGRLIGFGVGVAILCGLLFGVMPAIAVSRLNLMTVIKQDAAASLPGFGRFGGRFTVAAQTAMAMLLLIGAGLFVRTVQNMRSTDLGFRVDGLLYAHIEPRSGGIEQNQRRQFFEDAITRLGSLPGVLSATAAGVAPMGGEISVGVGSTHQPICPPAAVRERTAPDLVAFNTVAPRYFQTLGIRLVAGREFVRMDSQSRPFPVIVNEAFARTYFPGQQPVGQSVTWGGDCTKPFGVVPVIGVVADSRADIRDPAPPTIFFPLGGWPGPVTLIVRTANDASSIVPVVRRAMTELNANVPTFSESPLEDLVERRLRRERLLSSLLMTFAIVTTSICCLGIYGTLAYAVERRRREIGVRLAIGAQTSDVLRVMLAESFTSVAAGVLIGAALAIAANRWVSSLLYGVSSADPFILTGAGILFLLVAAAAVAFPSRAAARIDPVLVLRN
jgi:predicted permease